MVKVSLELEEAAAFYKATPGQVCWVPLNVQSKKDQVPPKFVYLPSILGEFVLKQRRTPWEVCQEIKCLIQEDNIGMTAENSKLV